MNKYFKTIIICVAILIMVPIISIFGATYNVSQSRRIAEIEDFPESYRDGLAYVKSCYPNSQFVLYNTGLDWEKDLLSHENQLRVGVNLIRSDVDDFWKSKDASLYDENTGYYKEIEPGWCQASRKCIEYYMDPRNFFNEKDVFMFLDLSYNESQTLSGVEKIVDDCFMQDVAITDNKGNSVLYAEALCEIGRETGVSPYLLACRIRQEQGSGKSSMISGSYSPYEGYYNYFNVGAYGSTREEIINRGLSYAKQKGWDSPYKSISGGAQVLAQKYIVSGANTLYLQHFNMAADVNGTVAYHIYMGNIEAPFTENRMMIQSLNINTAPYTFVIPVYKNMPQEQEQTEVDKEDKSVTKSLTFDNEKVEIDRLHSSEYQFDIKTIDKDEITVCVEVYDESTIQINGCLIENVNNIASSKVALERGFNNVNIEIKRTDDIVEKYKAVIINDDGNTHYKSDFIDLTSNYIIVKPETTVEAIKNSIQVINGVVLVADSEGKNKDTNTLCVSSDKIFIRSSSGAVVFNKTVFVDGDINKDGVTDESDMSLLKFHVVEKDILTKDSASVADINKDGLINVEDVGKLRNLITGFAINSSADNALSIKVEPTEKSSIDFRVALSSSNNQHVIDGFLKYNEGKIEAADVTNSGKIHFVVDGSDVMFENGKDHICMSAFVRDDDISFEIEIVKAYDFLKQASVDVKAEPLVYHVNNEDKATDRHTHIYEYVDNNDATVTSCATQTGVCKQCQNKNVRKQHGTQLELVKSINIVISPAMNGYRAIPSIITKLPSIKKTVPIWYNKNSILDTTSQNSVLIEQGDVLRLGRLVITPNTGFAFDEDTVLFINGKPFVGQPEMFGKKIAFSNIGEFRF